MNTLPYVSGTARMTTSGTQTTSLHKWKIVKNFSTSITVLRRFGVSCRIGTTWVEVQCNVSPELAVGSTQTQLDKNKLSENAATKSRIGKCETKKAREVCKELALNPVHFYPILRFFIGMQALTDPPGEISITELVMFVTVWIVTSKPSKKQIIFLFSISFLVSGVRAEDPTESSKPEDPNAWETHDYAVAAAMAILALLLTMGGAGVARRMCNRWRPLPATPAPVAPAVLAVPAAPAAPAVPPAVVPAFDIMGGLTVSPVPRHDNPTYDIPPELQK